MQWAAVEEGWSGIPIRTQELTADFRQAWLREDLEPWLKIMGKLLCEEDKK